MSSKPDEVHASTDYFKSLTFGPRGGVGGRAASDVLADFFYTLKGAEGTLRNWQTLSPQAKIAFLNELAKPVRGKDEEEVVFHGRLNFWRTAVLGVVFREALVPGGGDRVIAQGAFDALFEGKVGKR